MINGYDIKRINNEEVLYLYMDFNSEFARLDKKNKNLKKNIKNYIKNNNIDFKGSVIALVVGGALIGTLTFNKPKIDYNKVSDINTSKIVAIINENDFNNKVSNIEAQNIKQNNIEEEIKEEVNNTNNKTNKTTEKKTITNNKKVTSNTNVVENKSNLNENNTSNNQEEVTDNNTYVNLYRRNGSVEKIELEEYIIGVVGAEMPASFNIEALKAQSVLARTYAMNIISTNRKLTDNNGTQNYKSNNELKNMWGSSYNTYYNKIKNAVNSTKGLYLTYNGKIIDAVYHSTSNGNTEDSSYVWGNNIPYLKSVSSPYDTTNKSFLHTMFISYEELSNKLNNIIDINTNFNILNRNSSGRVVDIEINGITYSGVNFRTLLGLRSTDFTIDKLDNGVSITTKGYGHGVGMSQYGANGMANNGSSFRDILLHYYTGVSFSSL